MINAPLFFELAPWTVCLGLALAVRDSVHGPPPPSHPFLSISEHPLWTGTWLLLGSGFLGMACWGHEATFGPFASLCFAFPVATNIVRHHLGQQRVQRTRAQRETAWLIWRRGSIQDEIMRAREHEAMDRRLRRCRSTLLLSRGDAQDLDFLFDQLESKLNQHPKDTDLAVQLVGGVAAHLRHVFMERDQDDLPLHEACRHIARWADWLNTMGLTQLEVVGAPDLMHVSASKKVPSMLFLGAAEQMGIAALADSNPGPIEWRWAIQDATVVFTSSQGPIGPWSSHAVQDWDAAFMLRHGGIAHAGGAWHCELPLLPS